MLDACIHLFIVSTLVSGGLYRVSSVVYEVCGRFIHIWLSAVFDVMMCSFLV